MKKRYSKRFKQISFALSTVGLTVFALNMVNAKTVQADTHSPQARIAFIQQQETIQKHKNYKINNYNMKQFQIFLMDKKKQLWSKDYSEESEYYLKKDIKNTKAKINYLKNHLDDKPTVKF